MHSDFSEPHVAKSRRLSWFLLASASIVFANYWLTRHTPSMLLGDVAVPPAWPVLVDTLLIIPLIYLFMFRRNGRRVWIGAAMMVGTGAFVANMILPEQSVPWLGQLRLVRNGMVALFALTELALLVTVARAAYRLYRRGNDVEAAIESGFKDRFGDVPIARLLTFEARMWFYALFAPRNYVAGSIAEERFSYHLKDGHASNQQGFIMLILIELPILHVLLMLFWSPVVAWIVSLMTAYGLCFLIGEYRASSRRQTSIDEDSVRVRFGLLPELQIPLTQIDRVDRSVVAVSRWAAGTVRFCDSGNPNIVIHLKEPIATANLFGSGRMVERVFLGLDKPQVFVDHLDDRLSTLQLRPGVDLERLEPH